MYVLVDEPNIRQHAAKVSQHGKKTVVTWTCYPNLACHYKNPSKQQENNGKYFGAHRQRVLPVQRLDGTKLVGKDDGAEACLAFWSSPDNAQRGEHEIGKARTKKKKELSAYLESRDCNLERKISASAGRD